MTQKTQKGQDSIGALLQLSLLVTIMVTVYSLNLKWLFDLDYLTKVFFTLILGFGAVAIYIPLAVKLEEVRKKHGFKK